MIELDICKAHLNILDCNDDDYIQSLIEVAESAIERELNINLYDIPLSQVNIVNMCILQLVASMYQVREAAISNSTHSTYVFDYLKSLVKNYTENSFG
jgi:hypothetical protein